MEVCRLLGWDSEFFGFPIARVCGDQLDRELAAEIDRWCRDRQIACLYFLADSRDPGTARCAEDSGYRLVDVRVTLDSELGEPRDGAFDPSTLGRAEDLDDLVAIARVAHEDSRFYADAGFPRERCAALYETWIRKSFEGDADAVLVGRVDGRASGYLTCRLAAAEAPTGHIGLVAVAERARGRGVATALVRSGLHWFGRNGAQRVEVATQGRNLAAQRLYQAAGFRICSLRLWFHKWYQDPPRRKAT